MKKLINISKKVLLTVLITSGVSSYTYAESRQRIIEIDVVENPLKVSTDETPAFEDGTEGAYGSEFLLQGYIYPKGTLDNGVIGVDAQGNPEFPELVMGRWFNRGWHVGKGFRTVTGPALLSHHLFYAGNDTLTTDGLELSDVNVPMKRAITGGTGMFNGARGEQEITFLGFYRIENNGDPLIGVKNRIKFTIQQE